MTSLEWVSWACSNSSSSGSSSSYDIINSSTFITNRNEWQSIRYMDTLQAAYHYGDVIMGTMASHITSLTIVYSTVYSGADQRKHQSSASLAFVRWIHRGPVNSPHKWPVTRKMVPFDDVIRTVHCWSLPGKPVAHWVSDENNDPDSCHHMASLCSNELNASR